MPISIIVGGQFGSEGKGKVALEVARRSAGVPVTLVRVGGPNSGHTAYAKDGRRFALRQMPAGCIDGDVDVVFPPGSYIDVELLAKEISLLNFPVERVFVSRFARVIEATHKEWEADSGLVDAIGSTGSGVGAAVMALVARESVSFPLNSLDAERSSELTPFICDSTVLLADKLSRQERVIVEGTQGFGLSLLDGGYWPKATSRTTTAAGALAETGLSPLDVDDVTMVIRAFPIRVAGDSGPLIGEMSWDAVAQFSGRCDDLREYTTVTQNLRRVGSFDPNLVKRALSANAPNRLVLNHLDYVGRIDDLSRAQSKVSSFLLSVESSIERRVDWLGFSGRGIQCRSEVIHNG